MRTYENVLMGQPSAERSKRRLNQIVTDYRDRPYKGDPLLIEPADLEKLPAVSCIGRFHSTQPARDQEQMASGLVIIWLQVDFAFPIPNWTLERLEKVEWERYAQDFSY